MISVRIKGREYDDTVVLPGAPRVGDEIRLYDDRVVVVSVVRWDTNNSTVTVLVKEG